MILQDSSVDHNSLLSEEENFYNLQSSQASLLSLNSSGSAAYEEFERSLVLNSSLELIKCFVNRYNTRDSTILQLFDMQASFEYINIAQVMGTEEALTIMDQEVAGIDSHENSLSIDYDPQGYGFSLFYITFEGSLFMKNATTTAASDENSHYQPSSKQYKVSFMIEGRLIKDEPNITHPFGEVKETIITVKATKMDI